MQRSDAWTTSGTGYEPRSAASNVTGRPDLRWGRLTFAQLRDEEFLAKQLRRIEITQGARRTGRSAHTEAVSLTGLAPDKTIRQRLLAAQTKAARGASEDEEFEAKEETTTDVATDAEDGNERELTNALCVLGHLQQPELAAVLATKLKEALRRVCTFPNPVYQLIALRRQLMKGMHEAVAAQHRQWRAAVQVNLSIAKYMENNLLASDPPSLAEDPVGTVKPKEKGEGVDDYGGPYREFFSQFFAELQMLHVPENEDNTSSTSDHSANGGPSSTSLKLDPNVSVSACVLPFLLPSPNWKNGVGANREKFVLNGVLINRKTDDEEVPSSPGESAEEKRQLYCEMLFFLGQMIGICLRTRVCVRLDLAMSVWKQLVGEDELNLESALETLKEIDFVAYSLWKTLKGILDEFKRQNSKQRELEEQLEAMDLVFTTILSDGRTIELCEDGTNTAVTLANLEEYVDSMLRARTQETQEVMNIVKQGLHSIMPVSALALLTWNELEKRMCGVAEVDVKLLQANTEYDEDLSPNDDFIQRFWRVLESLESEDKRAFLRFVWARSRLPLGSAQFHQKFKIQALASSDSGDGNSSSTEKVKSFFTSSKVTPKKLQSWLNKGESADTVFMCMHLTKARSGLFYDPQFSTWVQYVVNLSKASEKGITAIKTLTTQYDDDVLYNMIKEGKMIPGIKSLAARLETEQMEHWVNIRKDPGQVFHLFKLDKAKRGILSSPQFTTWVTGKYIADLNTNYPEQRAVMIPTLKKYLKIDDDSVLGLIKEGKSVEETKSIATKVEDDLIQATSILLENPLFNIWAKYVGVFNKKYPDNQTKMIETLTRNIGDDRVAEITKVAKSKDTTKDIATRLEYAQLVMWQNSGKSADDFFELLKLYRTDHDFSHNPLLNTWVSYINTIVTDNPNKISTLFSTLEARFGDRPLLQILEAAKQFPKMESAATNVLSTPLFKEWMNYVKIFNKEDPKKQ
ncbi:hypothetical protein JG688_00008379 [Phytophthora aleatoria]|uniref:HECT domain-containing protein n=1 Tax=Phytophthora aleatoria TaxID=2496075 RepID=A0A8J5M7F9_9STRA|nr:hypothetical protein JG688_00008379 [Phytophthora aleatoria]